jgi:phage terminase small subunit
MSQLKTKEEMNNMDMNELKQYCDDLYMLWSQSTKIRDFRIMMNSDRVLLNDTSVIDVIALPENVGDEEE